MEIQLTLEGRQVTVSFDPETWEATVAGRTYPVSRNGTGIVVGDQTVTVEGLRPHTVRLDGTVVPYRIDGLEGVAGAGAGGAGSGQVKTPMTGRLVRIAVQPGEHVEKGDVLFVLEAMKMQNEVRSPVAGVVEAIHGEPGATLEPQTLVVEISS